MITILEYIQKKHIETDAKTGLAVGDILWYDCGWNRNLPCFVRVIEVNKTGKSCRIETLVKKCVSGNMNMYGEVVADLDKPGRPSDKQYRIKPDKNGEPHIKIDGYEADLWDGKPKTITSD